MYFSPEQLLLQLYFLFQLPQFSHLFKTKKFLVKAFDLFHKSPAYKEASELRLGEKNSLKKKKLKRAVFKMQTSKASFIFQNVGK